ncbi:MAG TPA: SRPBCC family protein [Nitrosopumilaceae archaeon]|nr:SRPBCC family protein [Nitrosopumilaceae archaeon]
MKKEFHTGMVTRSSVVHASQQMAWKTLSNISNLPKWIIGIRKCVITSKKKKGIGSIRLVTFQDGSLLEEQIVTWNPGQSFSYMATGKTPLRAYFATLSIKPLGKNSTKITWSGYIGTNKVTRHSFQKTFSEYDALYKNSISRLKSIIESR